MKLRITSELAIPLDEVAISFVAAQGAGGQNVNKVATAAHLRFDIRASSLPAPYKERLLALSDQRISREGIVVIKAQQHRTRERNREDALARLRDLLRRVTTTPRKRKPTRPTRSSRDKRLQNKTRRGQVKALRGKIFD